MWGPSATGSNPLGDADLQVAREVLHLVLAERPMVPTVGEIELALAEDESFAARDEVGRGVDELIRAGILRREGESILPTRATACLDRLLEGSGDPRRRSSRMAGVETPTRRPE